MKRGLIRRITLLAVICLLLFSPFVALSEDGDEDAFVSPTRPPSALKYDPEKPEELQDDQIVAHSFILMERTSGTILRERNADEQMYPASTTKIMTALLALKHGELTDQLTVSQNAVNIPDDASSAHFKAGDVITLKDALYGLMLPSGNDAANAIAEYISGDINTFVGLMNEEAESLGMLHTHFANPSGLFDPIHQTTAYDMAILMNVAMDHPVFRQIIATPSYTMPATGQNIGRTFYNTNLHIQPSSSDGQESPRYYKPSLGGKTGFHNQAGYCLVEVGEKDGVQLIAVVLMSGTYSYWSDVSWLLEYGFTRFKSVTPEDMYEKHPIQLQINGFTRDDTLPDGSLGLGHLDLDIKPQDPNREVRITKLAAEVDAIIDDFPSYINVNYTVELRAPITYGQVVGTLTFYPDGEPEAVYDLIATRSIAARTDAPPTLEEIEKRVLEDPSPFPPFGWDWVLPPVLIFIAGLLLLRAVIKAAMKRHKSKKQIPKPKRRYYS